VQKTAMHVPEERSGGLITRRLDFVREFIFRRLPPGKQLHRCRKHVDAAGLKATCFVRLLIANIEKVASQRWWMTRR
jgi:hypothetical protein